MITRRKAGLTSSTHGIYEQGYTRDTITGIKGCNTARWSDSQKTALIARWSLCNETVRSETLVYSEQRVARNTRPRVVHTARDTPREGVTREGGAQTERRQPSKVGSVTGVKS